MRFWAGLYSAEAHEVINSGVDLLAKTTVKLTTGGKSGKANLMLMDPARADANGGRAGV
jgi:hypothetical protein